MKPYTLKLFLFLCISILAACETQTVKPEKDDAEQALPFTELRGSLLDDAARLVDLADSSDSYSEQISYRARAAHLYIEAGDSRLAKQQRDLIKQRFDSEQDATDSEKGSAETTISLLSAEIAIAEQNLLLASELIAEARPVTREQQISYYTTKANINYLSADYMLAVEQRVQLDKFIEDKKARNRNNQKIWAALSNIPTTQLRSQRSSNPTTSGWLDLARVVRSGQRNISQLETDLLDWGTRHPDHPVGGTFLTELIDNYQVDTTARKHIAVILPMQGNLSTITDTIKNGILSAYYADSNSPLKPVISFYDNSDDNITFNQLYQQAIDDGASNIIGPLDKIVINQLAQQSELDIPVLTLNYSANELSYTDDLYQFGLSPADEAQQVADLAIRQNKMHAAVFYPDSEWGQRLKQAFTERYESLGGRVLTTADYTTDTNDYKRPIRAMLNLDQSSIRHHKVENIIGMTTKSDPYRRQDIDMIFLAATHQSARGIMPALKFHRAGDIPVYSTSHVYTGKINPELDRDLNGLIFCDLPWILQNTSPLAQTFARNWPEQENYTRLFALGIDAYHLIYNIDYLKHRDYAFYAGQTGNIQLTTSNRITRKLPWARFRSGKPVPFEPEAITREISSIRN